MDNVIQLQLCCVCGSPGMTMCENGKWLCKRHSPYTSLDSRPQYDTYLKQKGIELAYLFHALSQVVNRLDKEPELLTTAIELTKLKTMYHPLPFFLMLDKIEPNTKTQYLQDKNIFGFPSIYEPDEYVEIDSITTKARFWSKMAGSSTSIASLNLETVMNLPGRIGYAHKDKFLGLPTLPAPTDSKPGILPLMCGNCEGHGHWNIWVPGPGGRHLVHRCKECSGSGWCHVTDRRLPETPKNWLFIPEQQQYTFGYARNSVHLGAEIKGARIKSRLASAEFARQLSAFIGEVVEPSVLVSFENGTSPVLDVVYVAAGEITNSILSTSRK